MVLAVLALAVLALAVLWEGASVLVSQQMQKIPHSDQESYRLHLSHWLQTSQLVAQ